MPHPTLQSVSPSSHNSSCSDPLEIKDDPMVTIGIERAGVRVALHCRVSTPGNAVATAVDPSLPTVLWCHPSWLDSFYFYPQTEDPLFADGYNNISFDMRGHGLSTASGRDEGYCAGGIADDIVAGLDALGIPTVHAVGCAFGAVVAQTLASRHSHRVKSLVLISLPPNEDSEDTRAGYSECAEALVCATAEDDVDMLDAITLATFEYDAGALAPAVREIRDEYMLVARERLLRTEQEAADDAFYIWNPVTHRRKQTAREMAAITAPTLILQGTGGDDRATEDAQDYTALFNFVHSGSGTGARATLHLVDNVGHYMTLTSPNVVNPIIAKFIGTPKSARLPPLPKIGTRIHGPAEARRPSTPRTATSSFEIPPIPPRSGRTYGDEMDALRVSVERVTEVFV